MQEGYRLTDFTLEELSLLNISIDEKINKLRPTSNLYSTSVMIETLFEIQVRVLTAFSIVKERERIVNS